MSGKLILAIDPGLDTGWCLLATSGRIVSAGLGALQATWEKASWAILERPQVYRDNKSKGDPNDLITLAIQLGRYVEKLEAACVRTKLVLPGTWKGQIPKEIHHRRVLAALPPDDARTLLPCLEGFPKGKQHNILDAVALAKWAHAQKIFA